MRKNKLNQVFRPAINTPVCSFLFKSGIISIFLFSCLAVASSVYGQNPSNSKLSIQIYQNYTSAGQQVVQAHPKVLKIIKSDTAMMNAAREYKNGTPNGVVILRVMPWSGYHYTITDSPAGAANDFFTQFIAPSLPAWNSPDRYLIDYVEGPNEGDNCPTWGSPAEAAWFNDFWLTLTPLIVNAGYKPCLASMAVGNPPGDINNINACIAAFVPALRQAKPYGGAWGYHGYTYFFGKDPSGIELSYSLRYRRFYNYFAQSAPDLLDMPMFITEAGGEGGGGGWMIHTDQAGFTDWLTWWDGQLQQDSYIKGVTLFVSDGAHNGWTTYDTDPISPWLAAYLQGQSVVPSAPYNIGTTSGPGKVLINWDGGYGSMSYNVKRSASSGGPYALIANPSASEFTDTGVSNNSTYYYVVSGNSAAGEGPESSQISDTPTYNYKVNAGGSNAGSFGADAFSNGGIVWGVLSNIDTNGVTNPAPAAVYQSERVGDPSTPNFSYTFIGLIQGTNYEVRLHFAEIYFSSVGARVFNVAINGNTVLPNFDIVGVAGAGNRAVIRTFTVQPDVNNSITITFTQGGSSFPKVSGFEVTNTNPPRTPEDISSLINMSFQTSWPFSPEPQDPSGWDVLNWTSGGPEHYTSTELSSGRKSDHRCKIEFGSGAAGTDHVIAKEILWGNYTSVDVSAWCAARKWDASSTGTMSIGVDRDGNATTWSHADVTQSRTSNDETWESIAISNVIRPSGAVTFTLMLCANRTGTSYNCQFDEVSVTGVQTGPTSTPVNTPTHTPQGPVNTPSPTSSPVSQGSQTPTPTVSISTPTATPLCGQRVANGDFSNGSVDWISWTQRGSATRNFTSSYPPSGGSAPVLEMSSNSFNGGVYQVLSLVVGQSYTLSILSRDVNSDSGGAWCEVLAGASLPQDGQDYANGNPSGTLLLQKWDTITCDNWNGSPGCIANTTSFTASASTMYLVLKCGQTASYLVDISFDNVSICGTSPVMPTVTPTAIPTATPTTHLIPVKGWSAF